MRRYTRVPWPIKLIAEHMYAHDKDPRFVLSRGRGDLEDMLEDIPYMDAGGCNYPGIRARLDVHKELRATVLACAVLEDGAPPRKKNNNSSDSKRNY
jgi:hypothetical protein